MGLDASVRCNCWEKGLCKPPPVPIYVNDDDWIEIDEDQLDLDAVDFSSLPDAGELDEDPIVACIDLFDQWRAEACEHPEMDYAWGRVGSWGDVSAFIHFMAQIGWQRYPVLKAALPLGNDGLTPPDVARQMIAELEDLLKVERAGFTTCLIESASDEAIYEYLEAHNGIFAWSGEIEMGLNRQYFIIRDRKTQQIVFQARRFEQRILETADDGQPLRVEFFNGDDESRCIVGQPLRVWDNMEYPKLWHVEQRETDADDFADVIDTLLYLCQASIDTENPIRWH
jgi:hypothetical protein